MVRGRGLCLVVRTRWWRVGTRWPGLKISHKGTKKHTKRSLSDLKQLHRLAREIFDYALSLVDPRQAAKQGITFTPSVRPSYGFGIGKAARAMILGLEDVLGERLTATLISA